MLYAHSMLTGMQRLRSAEQQQQQQQQHRQSGGTSTTTSATEAHRSGHHQQQQQVEHSQSPHAAPSARSCLAAAVCNVCGAGGVHEEAAAVLSDTQMQLLHDESVALALRTFDQATVGLRSCGAAPSPPPTATLGATSSSVHKEEEEEQEEARRLLVDRLQVCTCTFLERKNL